LIVAFSLNVMLPAVASINAPEALSSVNVVAAPAPIVMSLPVLFSTFRPLMLAALPIVIAPVEVSVEPPPKLIALVLVKDAVPLTLKVVFATGVRTLDPAMLKLPTLIVAATFVLKLPI
jgi:hypothetical protein